MRSPACDFTEEDFLALRETPRHADDALGLWELPNVVLDAICTACSRFEAVFGFAGSNNLKKKYRVTMTAASSILLTRTFPNGIHRRMDFVPHWIYLQNYVDMDMLFNNTFGFDAVQWLTTSVAMPPVSPWHGLDMQGFGLLRLMCMFSMILKQEALSILKMSPVVSTHEAMKVSDNLLRITDQSLSCTCAPQGTHQLMIWASADGHFSSNFSSNSMQVFDTPKWYWYDPRDGAFCENFSKGSLHVVERIDACTSMMKVTPAFSEQCVDAGVNAETAIGSRSEAW